MQDLNIQEYLYDLPNDRIALFPLNDRDQSKLLVFRDGEITHSTFSNLTDFLPPNSFLFFNDTKVIPARVHFRKATGADIEIFLLDPVRPNTVVSEVMATHHQCAWHCTIGNLKRWTNDQTLEKQIGSFTLSAKLIDREKTLVEFSWNSGASFAEIIADAGQTPLPPYLKRQPVATDRERYQTVYSHYEGAVAAPTAGLHFTEAIFGALDKKQIGYDFLTLHVSAGTFQPIKAEKASDHVMHNEQIVARRKNLEALLQPGKFFIPVGTTSMRTLESIYWFGVKLLKDERASFVINQNDPYIIQSMHAMEEAMTAVLKKMNELDIDHLTGETSIFIRPGYQFRVCNALITNFHQPASTLILLVAAFAGKNWRKIYDEALANDYRFLSYGDSSLLFPAK
jgi:S-adenosylmethionine:tRNA ribosyltransferase-isomerase